MEERGSKLVTAHMIDALIDGAAHTQRGRTNLNMHESFADPVQRVFIAAGPGSYFRPHRHPDKSETILVVRGLFDVLLFDGDGTVTERFCAGPAEDIVAFEIPAGVCHTLIARAGRSVFLEVKQGPYDPAAPFACAAWAPEEGSAGVAGFQARLLAARPGRRVR